MWTRLRGPRLAGAASTQSDDSAHESGSFEDAVKGVFSIVNDDLDNADAIFDRGNTAFHTLGKGTAGFFRGLLAHKPETMREASKHLFQAATQANEQLKRVPRHPNISKAVIYPAGTEFTMCYTIAQLLRAVLAVLNGDLAEIVKGLYNLKKAYVTLDAITKSSRDGRARSSSSRTDVQSSASPSRESSASSVVQSEVSDDEEDDFFDAEEDFAAPDSRYNDESQSSGFTVTYPGSQTSRLSLRLSSKDDGAPNAVDRFVYISSNVAFGVLLLGISLIPAAFSMPLRVVGFRGDRDRGLNLLWDAAESDDPFGSFGALILFEYYNAISSNSNILSDSVFPKDRYTRLLSTMRTRLPQSKLLLLYENQMHGLNRDLEGAIALVEGEHEGSLPQMKALLHFVYCMNCMYTHRYQECSTAFEKCASLHDWSPAGQYYIAGAARIALYRRARVAGEDEDARKHGEEAERLFFLGANQLGKRKFFAGQPPLESFIGRKIQKWKTRASVRNIDFVDAVGVSPLEEMIFLWNGHMRMSESQLKQSLADLQWSETNDANWKSEDPDEHAIFAILKSVILRNQGRFEEAKKLLTQQIISKGQIASNGSTQESWPFPLAHLEMATNLWQDRHSTLNDQERLEECSALIEKLTNWQNFDQQSMFTIPLNVARESLQKTLAST